VPDHPDRSPRSRPGDGTAASFPARALFAAGLLGAALAIAVPPDAPAAARPAPAHRHDLAMLVSPTSLAVTISRTGRARLAVSRAARVRRLEIENRGNVRLDVHARVREMTPRPPGPACPDRAPGHPAASWVTVDPHHLRVRPGARRYVQVRFRVPCHREPGQYRAEIILMLPPLPGPGNIHLAPGIGVLAVITVPGRGRHQPSLTGLMPPVLTLSGLSPPP
jgi:hypothetical protein